MTKVTGAIKAASDAFVSVAPAASVMARTGLAYSSARSAREGAEFMRDQVSVERSLAEARATRDEATRAQRFGAAQSSQLALAAARGISLDSFRGVQAGNEREYERDISAIRLNRLNRMTQLDFMEGDAMRQAASSIRSAWLGAATGNAETLFRIGATEPRKRT